MIRDILDKNEKTQAIDHTMALLHKDFPQCFTTEGKFDIAVLSELLQDKVDLVKEGSGFNFLGKNYASLLGSIDTTTVLVPDLDHNNKPENIDSQNVYISGDNLDALKHLVKSYSGQVKCIYIDPPYNTGSDGFVYNDKFKFTVEDLVEKLSISEEQAHRILNMTTRGAASHAAWLTFMMPRLQFARDLLSDDGVIFISIDDNEQANLKLLCDYVFGEENFIANLIWQKKFSRSNDATYFSTMHDHILCYAKNPISINDRGWQIGLLPRKEEVPDGYSNPDNDPRGVWTSVILSAKSGSPSLIYEIETPSGRKVLPPSGRYWSCSKETFDEWNKDNRIWFGVKGDSAPRKKTFLSEVQEGLRPNSILFQDEAGNNQEAKQETKALFDGFGVFDDPKPVRLLRLLLKIANLNDDSIVVDFFSGSATTAHAIMEMNSENDGKRTFIAVQLPENLDEKFERTGDDTTKCAINLADSMGYPHTLDYVGFERIKRAAKKIKEQNPLFVGDLGFKHYTLQEPDENTLDLMLKFEPTQMFGDNLLDKFGKETVLATYAMRDGYGLTPTFEAIKFGNYTAYLCGKHLYMIDPNFSTDGEDLIQLVDKYNADLSFAADTVVLFGYCFNFSQTDAIKKSLGAIIDRSRINIDIRY